MLVVVRLVTREHDRHGLQVEAGNGQRLVFRQHVEAGAKRRMSSGKRTSREGRHLRGIGEREHAVVRDRCRLSGSPPRSVPSRESGPARRPWRRARAASRPSSLATCRIRAPTVRHADTQARRRQFPPHTPSGVHGQAHGDRECREHGPPRHAGHHWASGASPTSQALSTAIGAPRSPNLGREVASKEEVVQQSGVDRQRHQHGRGIHRRPAPRAGAGWRKAAHTPRPAAAGTGSRATRRRSPRSRRRPPDSGADSNAGKSRSVRWPRVAWIRCCCANRSPVRQSGGIEFAGPASRTPVSAP